MTVKAAFRPAHPPAPDCRADRAYLPGGLIGNGRVYSLGRGRGLFSKAAIPLAGVPKPDETPTNAKLGRHSYETRMLSVASHCPPNILGRGLLITPDDEG